MSNSTGMIPFEFEGFPFRVDVIGGEPWFVAKDIADALGYSWKGVSTISHVPQKWRGYHLIGTPSGDQEMAVLSEQGLYFFLGRSNKPLALPFQEKVAGEVMPSIRKTGGYGVVALSPLEQFAATASQVIAALGQTTLETKLLVETARQEVAEVSSRVDILEVIATPEAISAKVVSEVEYRDALREARERDVRVLRHHIQTLVRHLVAIKVERLGTPPKTEFPAIWTLVRSAAVAANFDDIRTVAQCQAAIAFLERHLIAFQVTPPARPEPSEPRLQEQFDSLDGGL